MFVCFLLFVYKFNEWNVIGNYIISDEGQSWSMVFEVLDNFSGFNVEDKGWIVNFGDMFNI